MRVGRTGADERDSDDVQRRLVQSVIDDGFCLVSSTEIFGKTVMRMCPINPRTTEDDLELTVKRIVDLGRRLSGR